MDGNEHGGVTSLGEPDLYHLPTAKLQTKMTNVAGGVCLDEQWTFGQIFAVVGFVPVFVGGGCFW